jgi:SulP family sulfate permease
LSDPVDVAQLTVADRWLFVGVDFSAAEAFVRIQRLLEDKQVVLVLCGCPVDSSVGIALRSVDLWADGPDSKVEVLKNLNDALEVRSPTLLPALRG